MYTISRVQWWFFKQNWIMYCIRSPSLLNKVLMSGNTTTFFFLWVDKFPLSLRCSGCWWNVTLLVIQWREIKFTMGCFLQLAMYHYRFWQFARQHCQSCWKDPGSSILQSCQQPTLEIRFVIEEMDSSERASHLHKPLFFFFSAPPSFLIALTLLSLSYKSLVLA